MLTSTELQSIRNTCAEWLPSIATVYTPAIVSDGAGGWNETQAPGPNLPCRIAPVAGGETGRRGDRIDERTTHILTLPAETVLEESGQVTVNGQAYDITLVRKRPGLEATRRVEVMEVS